MTTKRIAMALTAVVLMLTLAGCTGRTIVISWSPNPVTVKAGDTQIKGDVTIRTTGTLGSLRVDSIKVEALNDQGEIQDTRTFNIDRSIPLFVNVNHSEPVTLNVSYDDVVDNDVSKVRITVTGSDPGVLEIKVNVASDPV